MIEILQIDNRILISLIFIFIMGCGGTYKCPEPTPTETVQASAPDPDPNPTQDIYGGCNNDEETPTPSSIEEELNWLCGEDGEGLAICHIAASWMPSQKCLYAYQAFLAHSTHKRDYLGFCD